MPPQQNVIPGPFGYQFIPEHISTLPASPPAASPTPSSTHKLLDREELNTVDDFIDNPEINQTYNEADLGAMAETLPPPMFGWTSTMPTNETYTSHNSSSFNGVADYVHPLYHHSWQPRNHHPTNYHHVHPTYQPLGLAANSVNSSQSVNPLMTFSPTSISTTDRGYGSGLIRHNPISEGTFGSANLTSSIINGLEFLAPEPTSSTPPIGPAPLSISGPALMNVGGGTFTTSYQTGFRPLDMTHSYQFGNDTRFEPSGFVPLSDRGPTEEPESNQMGLLKCLQRTDSIDNTRSSSPVQRWQSQNSSVQAPEPQGPQMPPSASAPSEEIQNQQNTTGLGSRKRHRGVTSHEDDYQNENSPKPERKNRRHGLGRRGPRSAKVSIDRSSPASDTSPIKKPRSGRCNLSDGQKKANHTKAEQERRNAIKENFNELIELVPGLKSEKLNKCQSIIRIGDWLGGLAADNKKLRISLKELLGEDAFQEAFMGTSPGNHD